MSAPNDGGPIASQMLCAEGVMTPVGGMTKREYFAVTILGGIVADSTVRNIRYRSPELALTAVIQADALLAALNKEVEP